MSSKQKLSSTVMSAVDTGGSKKALSIVSQHFALDASKSRCYIRGLRVGNILRTWAEISMINFKSPMDVTTAGQSSSKSRSIIPSKHSLQSFLATELNESDIFAEEFYVNVTSLLNEDQLWGCFYTFPEIYADVYSPVVRIRELEDVPEIVGGVLTLDMITACLTYLKRTPILGDFVYIKLDLASKHLNNIEVLQSYKYLVYLDLSSNFLTELTVLSKLPYLQWLSVDYNRLNTVLEYDTAQWFLTEVHYKYNSVKKIRDLSMFWSLTILNLSHNNIKHISGLESLRYLRRLDLSFNHIQRLENLNHLRLVWLDVSYNNISSFEFGLQAGLWTLMHLEYLNLNENNLTSMKMFSGCTRIRELHVRNNRLSLLLELAVYMRQLRRLCILDLRSNPVCATPGYKDVVINTFPLLLSLDAEELEPVEQRKLKMDMNPDVSIFATHRLLRLLYIEQLSRARVSPFTPPADTTEVPIIIIVGYEAVGKGSLARRLANDSRTNMELARLHTTSPYHSVGHYIEITRSKFDEMLLAGDFLTYSEMDGESYGLSREEAFIKPGKVKICSMDLTGAMMMSLRGRRPYLLLASCLDKVSLATRQQERLVARNHMYIKRISSNTPIEKSTLQVLISGRILITGILNEILLSFPEEKPRSEFLIESECSLLKDSGTRQSVPDNSRDVNLLAFLGSNASSIDDGNESGYKMNPNETSLYSLYKESQHTDDFNISDVNTCPDKKSTEMNPTATKPDKMCSASHPKSVDFTKYVSSTWKGVNSTKSSKSVTFTAPENQEGAQAAAEPYTDPSGLPIDPPRVKKQTDHTKPALSLSNRMSRPGHGSWGSLDDRDLWMTFLIETGLMQASDVYEASETGAPAIRHDTKIDDPDFIIKQLEFYHKIPSQTFTTNIRDDYENIHRESPGLFWDTVTMDDPDEAFNKMKRIIREIVNSQKNFKPMFDIDFENMCEHYPTYQKRMMDISTRIAPQRFFH